MPVPFVMPYFINIISTYTKNVVTMVELNSLKSVWAFVFIFIHVDNLIKNSMSKYIWDAVHIVMKK